MLPTPKCFLSFERLNIQASSPSLINYSPIWRWDLAGYRERSSVKGNSNLCPTHSAGDNPDADQSCGKLLSIPQNGLRFPLDSGFKFRKACYTTQDAKEMLHCLGILRKIRIVDSQNQLSGKKLVERLANSLVIRYTCFKPVDIQFYLPL